MTRHQIGHLRHWLILLLAGELILFLTGVSCLRVFTVVAVAFLLGLLLRVLRLYPGKDEPYWLDLVSALLAIGATWLCFHTATRGLHPVMKAIIPLIIIMPHVVYILRTPSLGAPYRLRARK